MDSRRRCAVSPPCIFLILVERRGRGNGGVDVLVLAAFVFKLIRYKISPILYRMSLMFGYKVTYAPYTKPRKEQKENFVKTYVRAPGET